MAAKEKIRLVVFDVEGVLIPKNRFLFEVGKSLGFFKLVKLLFFGFLYEAGILKLKSTLQRIFKELKGAKVETLTASFEKIPATPFLQKFFAQLKARNCKTALISSGLPTFLVKQLAEEVGADFAFGIEVETQAGRLTGEIRGDAIESNGKLKILSQILTAEGLRLSDCAVVADERNNSCVFLPGMLKIGFNPDFILRVKADKVTVGKLSAVLHFIDGKPRERILPSRNDFIREDIHASGFFMPVIAMLIGVPWVAAIIVTVALVYTGSELWRLEGKELPVISTITRHAASQSELRGFAAAPLYFAFGILLTLLAFPAPAGFAAVAMFCLDDSAASLFGCLVKSNLPFNKGKTWLGTFAGFFFAFLAGLFFVSPPLALAGAAIAATIEVLPLPVNDNVLVPVITGAALTLLI